MRKYQTAVLELDSESLSCIAGLLGLDAFPEWEIATEEGVSRPTLWEYLTSADIQQPDLVRLLLRLWTPAAIAALAQFVERIIWGGVGTQPLCDYHGSGVLNRLAGMPA